VQALACPGRLAAVRAANRTLESVQAQLASYLAAKRAAFPRFHFISDAELVDLLSHMRDARAAQPHVPQLFEGAARLALAPAAPAGATLDVTALISAEGESLLLGRAIKARGPPEGSECLPFITCMRVRRVHPASP
jgi:dynein heavy chain, axonemal